MRSLSVSVRSYEAAALVLFTMGMVGWVIGPLWGFKQMTGRAVSQALERFEAVRLFAELRAGGRLAPAAAAATLPLSDARALDRLRGLIEACGLQLISAAAAPEQHIKTGVRYRKVSWRFTLEGGEAALQNFFSRLPELGFLCRVARVEVTPSPKGKEGVVASITLEKIDFFSRAVAWSGADLRGRLLAAAQPPKNTSAPPHAAPRRRLFKAPIAAPPPAPLTPATPTAPALLNSLTLVGIVDDNGVKAILEDRAAGQTVYLSFQDEVGDLIVEEITGQEVILSRGSERYRLSL